jgi:hypothetical protein
MRLGCLQSALIFGCGIVAGSIVATHGNTASRPGGEASPTHQATTATGSASSSAQGFFSQVGR